MEWLKLLVLSFQSIFTILFNPFFWLIIFLIYTQYKKVSRMEISLLGEEKATAKERVFSSFGVGILGGVLGTLLMTVLGVTVQLEDFRYILPLAIILMMINIRYLCFSYAGGIISLFSLIFGFPKVNVSSIIAIVAVLHLIESILIRIDGYRHPTPIFIRHDIYGIVGGFTLQRFWPIPFAVILVILAKLQGATNINLPDWWPLFIPKGLDVNNITLQLTVIVAALGYGDIAISSSPKEKVKKSSFRLALYSILLLILAAISCHIYIFKYIASLFAPIAHEGLIIYSQREEKKRRPIYKNPPKGITVLDVKRGSVAEKMGIKSGDIIWKVNNYVIDEKEDLLYILRQFPSFIWIEVIDEKGRSNVLEYADYLNGIGSLGAIIVPRFSDAVVSPQNNMSIIKNLFKKFIKK
ncbi:PDZ domain-containing protein [Caminicella sporogenes DSM 14501]|uniref:PDZ domain-containing protein n=1 Tax=Caminicella sporogenes DSM 14501 TaxID=1121266 RepID=A0A1M6QJH0_9FIRM|nr:PDZ domain-containing protein [Caminicella sporogenes]RKD25290.1 hypothetical protein BET04_03490 [Caminicella sporogenes]SHK20391.1 PDZ domain-containing protein [Caminicella sporogenes DSM 14501]